MSLSNIFYIAGSAMEAQEKKINVISTNIANTDSITRKNGKSYPYIAKKVLLKFSSENKYIGGVKIDRIVNSSENFKKIYDPNNPLSDKDGFIQKSNVNVVSEIIESISASRNYQANVEVVNTAKSLLMKTISIGQH
ncbi:Flagellar basal-body rod protein FlgC [Buchnera aphidicola (Tetraneura ulmi)]|uniref:flagellar basal body rod protein FlgC n=1 Tax=Buchnera aphidicola TaxID=9 RepID=UPI003463FA24